jgi:hypothetical protein
MPLEPWIFLSYGRPEHKLAHAISSALWSRQIEIYNYRHDEVVITDFKLKDATYQVMQEIAKLWVAIVTPRSLRGDDVFPGFREAVLNELKRMREGGAPLICLSNANIMRDYAFLRPAHLIDLSAYDSPRAIADKLFELIPSDVIERCQTSWKVNQQLSQSAWAKTNSAMHAVYDTCDLPTVEALLHELTDGAGVEHFLGTDIATLQSDVNRWFVIVKLSQCLQRASRRKSEALRSVAGAITQKDARLLSERVPEKECKATETIASASQLLRGMVRFADKVDILDYRGACDP